MRGHPKDPEAAESGGKQRSPCSCRVPLGGSAPPRSGGRMLGKMLPLCSAVWERGFLGLELPAPFISSREKQGCKRDIFTSSLPTGGGEGGSLLGMTRKQSSPCCSKEGRGGAWMMLLGPAGFSPASPASPCAQGGFAIPAATTCDFPARYLILLDIPVAAAPVMNTQTGN